MSDSRQTSYAVDLAVRNSACWYAAMFAAHGLASTTDALAWHSGEVAPPFHSNLVVLSPAITPADLERYAAAIEREPRAAGWSLKDSYARLDLAARGYSVLFEAEWIRRDPGAPARPAAGSPMSWTRVATAASLAEWERAWSGDTRNEAEVLRTRQFPDGLLASPDHAFFAGRLEGRIVAGAIANRSPGAVGLSNLFSPPEHLRDTWGALVDLLGEGFPDTPIVGYERGADLEIALGAGFVSVGKLRIWCRSAPAPG
jgi:hypothetical protein